MMNERLELLMNDVQMSTKVKIETRTSIRSMMKMEMKMKMKMDVLSPRHEDSRAHNEQWSKP